MKYPSLEKNEINKITAHRKCPPREKAFFTMMRQSGLKPHAIKQLKIENLERILESDPPIPCKISIKRKSGKPFAFLGNETVKYLKLYLEPNLKPENLLFHSHYDPDTPVNTKNISRAFKSLVRDLARRGVIQTSDLQLSSLTQFYKENAKYYTAELKKHASIKDDEFYRRLYEKKAMPFLEIEPPPPIEIYRLKKQQQKEFEKRDNEIRDLQEQLKEIHKTVFPKPRKLVPVDDWEAEAERIDKWIKEHPEEAEWEQRWYEQKVREQEELEEMMKRYPNRFVAYTHGLKDKIEAIQRVFQTMRERKNQETNKNSKTSETTETI